LFERTRDPLSLKERREEKRVRVSGWVGGEDTPFLDRNQCLVMKRSSLRSFDGFRKVIKISW